ncbi:MAG: Mpo1-like protein [Pseudomonadota bacterium]
MNKESKLLEMLTGYAAAHQHPFNVTVHMIGIPTIMLGVLIALSWARIELPFMGFSLAHVVLLAFVAFYFSLDAVFALVFAVFGILLVVAAERIAMLPLPVSGGIAAACFFGGYFLQFVGHAVEKSMPVLVKHPIQAQLAAPFFTVVELFKLLRLREALFDEVQRRIARQRDAGAVPSD